MKAMIFKLMPIILATFTLANCQESRPAKLTVHLTDDSGKPVPSYKVQTSWCDEAATWAAKRPTGIWEEVWTGKFAETDRDGNATFEVPLWKQGEVGFNLIQGLAGKESLYYLTKIPSYKFQRIENDRWIPENPVVEAVLKRKLNPIPMYVRRFGKGFETNSEVPGLDKEFGFDLVVSDWMPPHGKGKNADMFFTLTQKYTDPRNFDASLVVRFPNKGDGLIPAPRTPDTGSALRLDHLAPLSGYSQNFAFRRAALPPDNFEETNLKRDMNYYMRIRTVRDKSGRIISCNYGKIHGDFEFSVTGGRGIAFTYYLNPTPNDRNIEFDPTRNLFTSLTVGEEVYQP